MARSKIYWAISFTDKGDMLGPSYVLLLVLPGIFFFYFNVRTGEKRDVCSDTLIKLPIDWLKTDEPTKASFDSVNDFFSELINSSFIILYKSYTHLHLHFCHAIAETVEIQKSVTSNICISSVKNRNNVSCGFNIVAQNDNQCLFFYLIPCRKRGQLSIFETFIGSTKLFVKVPQMLTFKIITPFIVDSCFVLCRALYRDGNNNKSSKT